MKESELATTKIHDKCHAAMNVIAVYIKHCQHNLKSNNLEYHCH